MTPSDPCQKQIFIFLKKKFFFIFLDLSSKYPHLRLDKFTRLWALEHREYITPSADQWTFLHVPKRDMPSRLCLFFADFMTCAIFSKLWGKFLKNHNRYGHHVSCFCQKLRRILGYIFVEKTFKKFGFMFFFWKLVLKKRNFKEFLCLISCFSEPRPDTEFMVSYIIQTFHRLHICQNMTSKYFLKLVFMAKKGIKKCRSFTETTLPQDKQQGYKLVFVPTKLLS